MLPVMGHLSDTGCMHILVLMAASLLSPGALLIEPEKKRFSRMATDNNTSAPGNKGMEKAFLEVLDEHQEILLGICRFYGNTRDDQQDIFQEIVYQLWKAFPSFTGKSKISTWLYKVAINTAIIPYRRGRAEIELPGELPDIPAPEPESDEEFFTFINTLEPVDMGIVALLMAGYDRREISEMAGMNLETIKKRLTRLKNRNKNLPL